MSTTPTTPTTPLRTGAILLRVSTKKQAAEGMSSYHLQLKDCMAYAKDHDIHVPEDLIWQEIGSRGQYFTRDGLQAALTAARADKYQALIVWRIDRLTDSPEYFLTILRTLREHGALPWSAKEPEVDCTTEFGRDMALIKVLLQIKPERSTTAQRTQDNRRDNTEQGRPWASHCPRYGYRWIEDPSRTVKRNGITVPLKERLEPDPKTAPVVVWMYDWVDAGRTLKWIARALSGLEDGGKYKRPTPRQYAGMGGANEAGEWDEGSITRMLAFPGYMGTWFAYRTKRQKPTGGSEHSSQKPVPEDEWMRVEPDGPGSSPAPALVTPEQWYRVQQRLDSNKQYSPRNSTNHIGTQQALLHTGMARCPVCKGPMEARPRAHSFDDEEGNRVYQYRCRASRRNFPDCEGVSCAAEPLDRAVQLALYNVLRNPSIIAQLARRSQAEDQAEATGIAVITPVTEYRALKKDLDEMKRKLIRTTEDSADYDKNDARGLGYRLTIEAESVKVAAKEAQVEQAKRKADKYEHVERAIGQWMDYLEAEENNIDSLGDPYSLSRPHVRRAHRNWLELLNAQVIVNPYDTVRAGGPLGTLRLHLTAITARDTLPASAATNGALEVPVVPVAPEPLRHGGELPYWRRADYVEPEPLTAEESAARRAAEAQREADRKNPAKVAAEHGLTLDEATEYLAWYAALEAEMHALRHDSQALDEWVVTHTLLSPRQWLAERQPNHWRNRLPPGPTNLRSY